MMPKEPRLALIQVLALCVLAVVACGPQRDQEQEIAVAVALTQTAAALAAPSATPTSAVTPTPLPATATATAAAPTATLSPPAAAAALEQYAALSLGIEPGADEGIHDVHAIPLTTAAPAQELWLIHTVGLRNVARQEFHLLILYRQTEQGWQELATVELNGISAGEASPDYLAEDAVQQVQLEPTTAWVQVEGIVGARGGYYALFQSDGEALQRAAYASNVKAGVGQLDDLNGDGIAEVVLDASDYYVFCYGCGARYAQYNILRWDGVRLTPITLAPLPASAPAALRAANDRALNFVAAGLWPQAVAAIDDGIALNVEEPAFEWNAIYIQYNAAAKAAVLTDQAAPGYPILDNVFYGDYAAAVDLMRSTPPAQIFSLRTPLIAGTNAEGATRQLATRILSSVEPVLRAQPELAAAYYLRAWATFLKNGFADDAVLADVAQAAQLDRDDELFAATVVAFGGDPATLSAAALTSTTTLTAGIALTTSAALTATPTVAMVNTEPQGAGSIYFSALDVDGRSAVFVVAALPAAQPARVVPDAIQPVMHPQGDRLAFHSTRDDMLGLGGYDLSTSERLRFAYNIEDALPTWNPAGDQLFFASTRYGDGRWRLYQLWADGNGEATDMRYGQDPAWHPSAERIVYKGCDDAGGNCGLWLMNSDGSDRQVLTSNSGDSRPRWTPTGDRVVFMSDQRDGNWEVYAVALVTGNVTRLITSPANDGLPVVSPDGTRVAFYSDRQDGWAIWVAPLAGGEAERITPVGDLPNWLEQGMDWIP